jgi:hypothetical protein
MIRPLPRSRPLGSARPAVRRALPGAALLAGLLVAAAGAGAAPPTRSAIVPPERNCFWQLQRGTSDEIVCDHLAWLTPEERADLRKVTRDLVTDASCIITVRIPRATARAAIEAPDHVFEAPPQRVTCNIHTADTVMPISATFSPRVVIRGGVAVEATPGLANVEGVHKSLAWPVVAYVNRAQRIRTGMLAMINAYLGRRAAAR